MKNAALWTDGRYFLQAEKELDMSTWTLMKAGLPGTPSKEEWVMEQFNNKSATFGFDPTLVSFDLMEKWKNYWSERKASITPLSIDTNLIDRIWTTRPSRPCNPISELASSFCGKSFQQKLEAIRAKIEEHQCSGLLISSLDEIAWVLNWRGSDIEFNPVFYSYLWIGKNFVRLYINPTVCLLVL